MSIIKATIRGTDKSTDPNNYKRLGISRKDSRLFDNIKDLEINYRKEKIKVNLDNKTFKRYGEINHNKIKEWSGNKLSTVEIDIRLIKNGKIKIIKIMPTIKKITKKVVQKRIKRMRPKGIRPMKQNEFLEVMGRLRLIDEEVKKEKELFDIKIKSLKLEKEYLKNKFKENKE